MKSKLIRTRKAPQRKNVVSVRRAWQHGPSPQRARPRGEGARAEPDLRGAGDFYHVQVRPKGAFRVFRTQDVGKRGGIERVAGRRADGSWSTQKWLIGKEHAHVEDGCLVGDTPEARKVLRTLMSTPHRVRGDRFAAKPRSEAPRRRALTQREERQERRLARRAHGDRPPPPGAPTRERGV
jgi:hypothetical protein